MLTYSRLGDAHHGNLGNQLFQIASTFGLARRYGHKFALPPWKHAAAFPNLGPYLGQSLPRATRVPERHFHLDLTGFGPANGAVYDVDGWRQSEAYWKPFELDVRHLLAFDPALKEGLRARFSEALDGSTVAVSVRRGDFVGNPNYEQLPITYYLLALIEHFPGWQHRQFLIFSDDLGYCRVHLEGLPNVHFADGLGPVEQLCLMAECKHFVVSNSTFSWWGAWLGEKSTSLVVRPARVFAGKLREQCSERDYWPARWQPLDHAGRRLDLRDVTFTVPVFIDHPHRRQNLELSVCVLQRDLDTNVLIGEQGSQQGYLGEACAYGAFPHMKAFHRTKMLNDMARAVATPYVVNWDADVFVPPLQLWLAVERLRAGDDMVFPFDGRCARVPRSWHRPLERALDVGVVGDTEFKGKAVASASKSVGCAILFNRASFLAGGGENEHFVSFGPEDVERLHRFRTLGYAVSRVPGALYHLDHWCGPDSSSRNPHFKRNHQRLREIQAMSPAELAAHVEAWPWRQEAFRK